MHVFFVTLLLPPSPPRNWMERLQSAGPKFCPVDGAHLSAAISVILVGHKCNYRWCWGFLSFRWMVVAIFVFKDTERSFCKCIGWVFLKTGYRLIPYQSFVPPSHKRQLPSQPHDPFERCALSSWTGKAVMFLVWNGYLTIIDRTFAKKSVHLCINLSIPVLHGIRKLQLEAELPMTAEQVI